MARRKGFLNNLAQAQREIENLQKAQRRAQEQAAKELEKKRRENQQAKDRLAKEMEKQHREEQRAKELLTKEMEKKAKENEKEQARLYLESRIAEVDLKNAELDDKIEQLNTLLQSTLSVDDYLDLDTLKKHFEHDLFVPPTNLTQPRPKPSMQTFLPPEPTGLQKLIPGTKAKYEKQLDSATAEFKAELAKYTLSEQKRAEEIDRLKEEHIQRGERLKQEIDTHNAEIDQFKKDLETGQNEAIINYCTLVLETSIYPDDFPQHARVAFVPESKQLVIEYDLPSIETVPEVNQYKYLKAKDEITTTSRPSTQRKSLYTSLVAQITLRTIHELFEADRWQNIETIVFNGYVKSIDRGTGRDIRTCLVTVRTDRDVFNAMDLSRVDPEMCLKNLNASVSKSPSELVPVRPVLEFSMVDSRFVEETDIISSLDQRTNLMDLSPSEFESLITNLFQKMGLEARQTQASRDGGVDCVAFDPRPIFGGKVIIQAKRYKNTVGVSAVRDLYGTLQNEGASKGILVTTSGYGKAAFEFADGKPIELLSGSNLLYLLKEHAGIDAKIEIPSTWKDPSPDNGAS